MQAGFRFSILLWIRYSHLYMEFRVSFSVNKYHITYETVTVHQDNTFILQVLTFSSVVLLSCLVPQFYNLAHFGLHHLRVI